MCEAMGRVGDMLRIKKGTPKLFRTFRLQRLPAAVSSLSCPQPRHIGSALFSPVLLQALNGWHHAPRVGFPFQSSSWNLPRIKKGTPKLFRTFRLQRLPAAISSLTCHQQPPNSRELPQHRECPLQSDSNAQLSRNLNLFSFHGLLSPLSC